MLISLNFRVRRAAAIGGSLLVVALLSTIAGRSGQADTLAQRAVKHKSAFHRGPVTVRKLCIRLTPNDPNCPQMEAVVDKGTHTSFFLPDTGNVYVNIDRVVPVQKSQSQVRVTLYDVNESDNGPFLTISRFLQPSPGTFNLEQGSLQVSLKTLSQRPANVHAVMIALNATDVDQKPLFVSGMLTFPQR